MDDPNRREKIKAQLGEEPGKELQAAFALWKGVSCDVARKTAGPDSLLWTFV